MPIALRTTPQVGNMAASGTFTVNVPSGTQVGDLAVCVIGVASANASAPPAAPTGWTRNYAASAGTSQYCAVYTAPYTASLGLVFTNAGQGVASCAVGFYFQAGATLALDVAPVAAASTTNNATMTTGQPRTGADAGDYEVLCYAHTTASGSITGVASGTAIDAQSSNPSAINVALGHNTTTSLPANTTMTAWNQTLSATNRAKTGVGVLLKATAPPTPNEPLQGPTENFDDGSLDTGTWLQWGTGTLAESGGTLNLSAPASPSTGYIGVLSNTAYDYTDRSTRIELVQLPSSTTGSQAYLRLEVDASNAVIFGFGDGNMFAQRQVGGTTTDLRAIAWPAGTRFLKITFDSATASVFFDYSTDGAAWTQFHVAPTPITITALKTVIGAGTYVAVASPGTARFDNLNLVPIRYRDLAGTSNGTSTVAGAPARRRGLVGASNGVATASGTLKRKRSLAGTADGVADASGLLTKTRRRDLAGLAWAASTVSGTPSRRRPLAGVANGVAIAAGAVQGGPVVAVPPVFWTGTQFSLAGATDVLWDTQAFLAEGAYPHVGWATRDERFALESA